MKTTSFLLSALAAVGVIAQRQCGAPEPTTEQIESAKSLFKVESAARLAGNATSLAADITVNTYFHVVASARTTAGGYLTVNIPHGLGPPPPRCFGPCQN